MQTGERSGGVTLAAIVVFLGSAVALLAGVTTFLSLYVFGGKFPNSAGSAGPFDLRASAIPLVLFYLGFTAGGIATGVGLLRLKAWARASILVFSGLMLAGCGMGSVAMFLLPLRGREVPGGPPAAMVREVAIAVLAVPMLIAVWWLVYFNLATVKKQFEEYPTTGEYSRDDGSAKTLFLKPHRPLSITLIALMYLVSVPFLLIAPFTNYPVVLFGYVITGSAARVLYLLYLSVIVYAGVGLLKLKEPARLVAIALNSAHFVSTLCFAALPGLEERLKALFDLLRVELPPPMTVSSFVAFTRLACCFGLAFTLLLIWVLVTRRTAFARPEAQAAM